MLHSSHAAHPLKLMFRALEQLQGMLRAHIGEFHEKGENPRNKIYKSKLTVVCGCAMREKVKPFACFFGTIGCLARA